MISFFYFTQAKGKQSSLEVGNFKYTFFFKTVMVLRPELKNITNRQKYYHLN